MRETEKMKILKSNNHTRVFELDMIGPNNNKFVNCFYLRRKKHPLTYIVKYSMLVCNPQNTKQAVLWLYKTSYNPLSYKPD